MDGHRRRLWAGAVALTLTGGLGVGPLGTSTPATAAATDTTCTQALILAVPGAGQGSTARVGVDAMGKTLRPLASAIIEGAVQRGRTISTVTVATSTLGPGSLRGTGGRNTAATKAVTRTAWRAWRSPVTTLTGQAWSALTQARTACPDQLVYLIGFSQGAEALHRLVTNRADADLADRTIGVYLIGDSSRTRRTAARVVGDPAAPRTGTGVTTAFSSAAPLDVPSGSWVAPVRQLCSAGDVVCDLSALAFGQARDRHLTYADAGVAPTVAAQGHWLGRRAAQWPVATDQTLTARVGLVAATHLTASVEPAAVKALRWQAVSGVPAGMHLSSLGVLSGTPTAPGTYDLTFTVRNTSGPDVDRPMPGHATVVVNPDLSSHTSAGGRHTCSVRSDGTLWCWGANFYGQLGQGDQLGLSAPKQVGTATTWASVATGGMHTCGVRTGGSLWCWGLNDRGQLGLGTRGDHARPVRVGTGADWREVTAGWRYTCGLRQDGSAWCWGDNAYGQLGDGTSNLRLTPAPVAGGGSWSSLQAGGWHVCGVRVSGDGLCWGRNLDGQLGDGTRTTRRTPTPVSGGQTWATLAPSWTHTCGLATTGAINCWGSNDEAQLGTGDKVASSTPTALAGTGPWAALATGAGFGCALDGQGLLWCWGTGRYGELGSTTTVATQPVRVGTTRAWAGLTAGWLHACVTAATGAPACWGDNETGQLGNGGTAAASSPGPVAGSAAGAPVTTRGLWEPAFTAEVPAAVPAPARAGRASRTATSFRLVSMNALGSQHTAPRADANEYAPARLRSEWAIDYLDGINASIVGFQEIQQDQLSWFVRAAGDQYDVWPGTKLGPSGVQTSVAWKSSDWTLIGTDSVEIPFLSQTRLMPLLHLQSPTGTKIWVMNIHNAPQGHQSQRNVAVARELKRLKPLIGTDPVYFIGDFNEKERVFCAAAKVGFGSPRGGSYADGACHPPSGRLRIDWIFGTKEAGYSAFREDRRVLAQRITDHAVVSSLIALP